MEAAPEVRRLAALLREKAGTASRFMVGIAGPPGSGKSTLSEDLKQALLAAGETAEVVPMDGFHFDDAVLNARGHRPRKGAHYTFDARGFEVLLRRIKAAEPEIAIPVFDRGMELARAAAAVVEQGTRFVLVEGLYLLLRRPPWDALKPLFDVTVYLDVPVDELERRLTKRILGHGFDAEFARQWIASNDMLNIEEVRGNSMAADLTVS